MYAVKTKTKIVCFFPVPTHILLVHGSALSNNAVFARSFII